METQSSAENATRLQDWLPLDLQGKPLYQGIDEHRRMDSVRPSITTVRRMWNDRETCQSIRDVVLETIKAETLSRDLCEHVDVALQTNRFWADQPRLVKESPNGDGCDSGVSYDALRLYTSNAGYKKVFGYINQVFRKETVDSRLKEGAVALVELLTIDMYNLRLDNFGCSKFYNFQDVVHRGMSVTEEVMKAFHGLLEKPVKERNFSVPLTFVSTSTNRDNIQEFLNTTEQGKQRLHWKIHVRELDPRLLASYRQSYPASIVSTICAMPISTVSEFPNEQEVLLRGTSFQLLRIYEEPAADHTVHVLEMVMLNANRDHSTELAHHHGHHADQRIFFGRMCAATKYGICASLAEGYGLPEAKVYKELYEETLDLIGWENTRTSLTTAHYNIWNEPRPSWIGASVEDAFPKSYARRRRVFSEALWKGEDYAPVEKIIADEYEWQRSDWCNVPRLFDTISAAQNGSGFTALHQAAYNNASPDFVRKLIDLGAWRTMKTSQVGNSRTPQDIAIQRRHYALVPILEPHIYHAIAVDTMVTMERSFHALMCETAGDEMKRYAIRSPQLSVLTEMDVQSPSLWVPIPGVHGGFVITLHPDPTAVRLHVIYISHTFPKTEKEWWIRHDGELSSVSRP